MGKIVHIFNYPWYYLPVWFLVTLPVFVVIFLFYFFKVLREMLGKKPQNNLPFLFFVAFLFNFLIYLKVKPIIYDGTRHFTYLVPIMVFMAYMAVVAFFQKKHAPTVKQLAMAFLVANTITIGIHMVRLHPYEYIYYNQLVGGVTHAYQEYETDYWGTAASQAAKWLVQSLEESGKSAGGKVKVFVAGANGYSAQYYFPDWIELTRDKLEADYMIGGIRRFSMDKMPGAELYTVSRMGVPLVVVKDLK